MAKLTTQEILDAGKDAGELANNGVKEAIVAAGQIAKYSHEQILELIKERDGWKAIAETNASELENAYKSLYEAKLKLRAVQKILNSTP